MLDVPLWGWLATIGAVLALLSVDFLQAARRPHAVGIREAASLAAGVVYTQALAEAGITPSIGTVGDALDNGLMESAIGLYKTECISRRDTWANAAELERETADWVHWYNTERVHTALNLTTPVDYEQSWATRQQQPAA